MHEEVIAYDPGPLARAILCQGRPGQGNHSSPHRGIPEHSRWCPQRFAGGLLYQEPGVDTCGFGNRGDAVSNLFAAGDTVLAIRAGKFGERWAEISTAYGLAVVTLDLPWGKAPSPQEVAALLDKNKNIKGVLTTHCETSSGTVFDIKSIAEITRSRNVLLVVDAISGLGQDELRTDEWGVDVVVSGSQKGFMLPPGLAFISLNQRAQEALKRANLPRYYFNLNKALKSYDKKDTPFTPAVSLVVALAESLTYLKSEGIETRWKRFERMALATREAALAMGLKMFSQRPSASVTAIVTPQGIPASQIVKTLRKEYGVGIAAGQEPMKDELFRIAHMGWINEQDLFACFSLLEYVLKKLGYDVTLGTSVKRLEEVLYG